MKSQYRGRQGKEEAVFVFHQQQINVFYNCTILCMATTAFISTVVILRRKLTSLEGVEQQKILL